MGKVQKVQTNEKNSKSQEMIGNIVNNIKMQRHAKWSKYKIRGGDWKWHKNTKLLDILDTEKTKSQTKS